MIGTTLARRYEIEKVIGSGGMAVVYRAHDRRTQRPVAVKVLREEYINDQEFLRRFDREAIACAKMRHPNIVNLIDIGEEGDTRFLVMEYVEGSTLKEVIQEQGQIPPDRAVLIALQALSALRHAHQKHIVHRDIKPQNILIDVHGDVKITDFGIARMTDAATATLGDGNVMGSVHYFSPEQAKGRQVTAASDLYSLGVVLYEMLAGRVPFDGDTPVAVAMQHINDLPKPVSTHAPQASPAIEEVLAKAMCKDIPQRYHGAEQMFMDLRRALRQPTGGFVKMRPAPTPLEAQRTQPAAIRRTRNRWRGRMLFVLTLLLCAGVIGAIATMGYRLWVQLTDYTTIPDVVGFEETLALGALRRADLEAAIERERSDRVLAGFVIHQEPAEGGMLRRGEEVLLRISLGSGKVQVPSLVGLAQELAEQELSELGLVLNVVEIELSVNPVGQVTRQEIPPGAEVEGRAVVDVFVSGGLVVVPDVLSQPFSTAEETLNELGLLVGDVGSVEVDNARQDTLVLTQDPKMGEAVFPGAEIKLSVGRFDARPFRQSLSLRVIIPEGGARVRVTLLEPDGRETEQYAAMHTLAGATQIPVELRSTLGREMTYRVYIDNTLVEENLIDFE